MIGNHSSAQAVVYAAAFGDSDPVMPVLRSGARLDHLVLTDRPFRVPRPWRVRLVKVPPTVTSDRMRNRWCKIHASRLLPEYDVSFYVDTHLQIVNDLDPLVAGFRASGAPVGLMTHPKSRSIAHEVERAARSGRISPTDLAVRWPEQRDRLLADGFLDDLGVFLGGILLRDHRHPGVAAFEDAWWEELVRGVPRDQVALPYALWRTGTEPFRMPLDWSLSPYFHHWRHLPGSDRYGRLVRWFDARVAVRPSYRWVLRALRPWTALRMLRSTGVSG